MQHAVVMGLGQLGAVFAEALLKEKLAVFPLLRGMSYSDLLLEKPPELCVVAVGEDDLVPALSALPEHVRRCCVLLQNELRPLTYQAFFASDLPQNNHPDVCIVWFEKKAGKVISEVRPSVVFGPSAARLQPALERLGLHVYVAADPASLHHELVLKNLYILGLNLFGLQGQKQNRSLSAADLSRDNNFWSLVDELILLEQALLRQAHATTILDAARLRTELREALDADPHHAAAGRSAPARLRRTAALIKQQGLSLPMLQNLAASTLKD